MFNADKNGKTKTSFCFKIFTEALQDSLFGKQCILMTFLFQAPRRGGGGGVLGGGGGAPSKDK